MSHLRLIAQYTLHVYDQDLFFHVRTLFNIYSRY